MWTRADHQRHEPSRVLFLVERLIRGQQPLVRVEQRWRLAKQRFVLDDGPLLARLLLVLRHSRMEARVVVVRRRDEPTLDLRRLWRACQRLFHVTSHDVGLECRASAFSQTEQQVRRRELGVFRQSRTEERLRFVGIGGTLQVEERRRLRVQLQSPERRRGDLGKLRPALFNRRA